MFTEIIIKTGNIFGRIEDIGEATEWRSESRNMAINALNNGQQLSAARQI
jgi:hypothetical protein